MIFEASAVLAVWQDSFYSSNPVGFPVCRAAFRIVGFLGCELARKHPGNSVFHPPCLHVSKQTCLLTD